MVSILPLWHPSRHRSTKTRCQFPLRHARAAPGIAGAAAGASSFQRRDVVSPARKTRRRREVAVADIRPPSDRFRYSLRGRTVTSFPVLCRSRCGCSDRAATCRGVSGCTADEIFTPCLPFRRSAAQRDQLILSQPRPTVGGH